MKSVLVAIAIMFSTAAFAGGKLTLKPSYHTKSEETNYMLGLSVYQPIMKSLAYKGWVGGELTQNKDEQWTKTEQGVEAYYKRLAIGIGGSYEFDPHTKKVDPAIYSNVSVTLW